MFFYTKEDPRLGECDGNILCDFYSFCLCISVVRALTFYVANTVLCCSIYVWCACH